MVVVYWLTEDALNYRPDIHIFYLQILMVNSWNQTPLCLINLDQ
jgi:hypothetical protein